MSLHSRHFRSTSHRPSKKGYTLPFWRNPRTAGNGLQEERMPRARASRSPETRPRVRPTQERAQRTVALILDHAAELLDEAGAEGLTTKQLAERAGIRIRSVYRYFPNRLAIIRALAERMADGQRRALERVAGGENAAGKPWRDDLRERLDSFLAAIATQRGLGAVRDAMRSSPVLRAVDEAANDELARAWADDLRRRGVVGGPRHRNRVARTAVEIATTLLDRVPWDEPAEARLQVRELRLALESYLARYLDGPATATRRRAGTARPQRRRPSGMT